MAVTYNAGTIEVTTSTYTLDQINTAIGNNAYWEKLGEAHFCKVNLKIFNSGKIIDNNSSFQLGSSAIRKTFETTAGTEFKLERCLIAFYLSARKNSWGLWEFKKSTIIEVESTSIALYMRGTQNHSDSIFQVAFWYNRDGTCSYDNCKVYNSGTFYYYTSGTINLLYVSGHVMSYYNSPTFKNTTMAHTYAIATAGIFATFINSSWAGALSFSYANNYLLEKWEFNILVKDDNNNVITGADVELKDKYGDVKHTGTTEADGKLVSAWEVLANRYDGTSETKTEYNPFTLKVTKGADETEYKIKIDHKIEEDVVLLPQSVASYDNIMTGINDIKGTGFVKDTDSLIDIRPETGKIQGVKDKTDNIPASPAPASEYDTEMARITADVATEAKQDITDGKADTIQAKTDNLKDTWNDPTVTQIKNELEGVGTKLTSVKNQTDKLHFSGDNIQGRVADKGVLNNPPSEVIADYKADVSNLDATVSSRADQNPPSQNIADYKDKMSEGELHSGLDSYGNKGGYKADVADLKKYEGNKMVVENNRLKIYDDNGVDVIKTFNLFDEDGNPAMTNIFRREPV